MTFTKHLKWSFLDTVLVSGSNFFLLLLGAKFLPIEDQGKLGLYFSFYVGLVVINATLIFQNAAVKAPRHNDQPAFLHELFVLQLSSAFLTSAISVSGLAWLLNEPIKILHIAALFGTFFLQQVADFYRRSCFIFKTDYDAFFSGMVLYPLRLLLILLVQPNHFSDLIFILLISLIPISIRVFLDLAAATRTPIQKAIRHASDSKWLLFTIPFVWSWANIPVLLLNKYAGLAAVAIYTTLRSFVNFSGIFLEMLENKGSSVFGKKALSGTSALTALRDQIIGGGIFGWGIFFILLVLFGELLLNKAYGPEYARSSLDLLLFWIAQGFIFLFRTHSIVLRSTSHYKMIFFVYLSGTLSVIAVSMIINRWGTYDDFGALLSLILAAFIMYFLTVLLEKRQHCSPNVQN